MEKDILIKMKDLIETLNKYRNAYYNNNESLISDKEYDDLFDELQQLENESGIVISNSPTQNVGYEVMSELKEVIHSHPMLSLDKTKDDNDLIKFAGEHNCILSCKMDGLTILLTYDDGKLIRAETRGDGKVGEDITHNAKVFDNIPLTIPYKHHIEFEGEAIITYEDFEKINKQLPEDRKYKNPRNLASGSVRQLDSAIAEKRHLKFIIWKMPKGFDYYLDGLLFAKNMGFEIVPYLTYCKKDKYELNEMIDSLKQFAKSKSYPIDGLVMTYNDKKYGESLGITGHHPKHSIAFKFYDEEVETILKDIEWTMGKTGVITPTAIFEPVELEGTIVEKASLHNISIMKNLELSYGDTITVYKANKIIPQVKDNLDRNLEYICIPPIKCPVCGGQTIIVKDNDTEVLKCSNPNCKGKLLKTLCHFVSKNAMNIDGLSEATLEKFIDKGYVESFIDIYELKNNFYNDIIKMDGFGKKSVDKLMDSIEKSKNTTLDRFINALSIPNIGRENSKTISKYFNDDFEEFFKAWSCGFGFLWKQLKDFGSVMHTSMAQYALDNLDMVKTLATYMNFKKPQTINNTNLSGKIFVITGNLNIFLNREDAKNKIESLGGKVSNSISKNTSYLINNDINSTSSKNKKAKELNIPIITEEELINILNN